MPLSGEKKKEKEKNHISQATAERLETLT